MAHELWNSIKKERESNIQKAISIQIKDPPLSSIPLLIEENLTLLVLRIPLTPGYFWQESTPSEQRDTYRAFFIFLLFLFSLFIYTVPV
jgi:hypothetical protein